MTRRLLVLAGVYAAGAITILVLDAREALAQQRSRARYSTVSADEAFNWVDEGPRCLN